MADEVTYPGVYVEELPSGVRSIPGVPTSVTAFVGRALRGPILEPVTVHCFNDFEQSFGGPWADGAMPFAVRDFFLNGGTRAVVVRLMRANATPADGDAGGPLVAADLVPDDGLDTRTGLYALDNAAGGFNLLCVPPYTPAGDVDTAVVAAAATYCERRRAMLLVDPPAGWVDAAAAVVGMAAGGVGTDSPNAALYFPRLRRPNPLRNDRIEDFAPCGAVAGVYARTDAQRGVWKAPAGQDVPLVGVPALSVALTAPEASALLALGVNSLRSLAGVGPAVWGARTLRGTDAAGSDWMYVPIRRLALFIEESLDRGLRWAVFEPNGEPLWERVRLAVGAFLQALFREGAFQGATPREAYSVRCDATTMTQDDLDRGNVNVVVGFAPLSPAEFVLLRIQLLARPPTVPPECPGPYAAFRFRLWWGGRYVAGVSQVSGLDAAAAAGADKPGEGAGPDAGICKIPGLDKHLAITLKRGVIGDAGFYEWVKGVSEGGKSPCAGEARRAGCRRDVRLGVYDEAGRLADRYRIRRCWVSDFRATADLNAKANAVGIETMTLENEGWERDAGVPDPAGPEPTPSPAAGDCTE